MPDPLTPLRILIIEDCESDHDLLMLKLREAGFAPHSLRVETVAEIREALLRDDWQIVFSDFDLPGFDGLLALEVVRQSNAEIPFFIVSGVIDEEQAVATMKAGAQDYFFKGKLTRLGPAVSRELRESEQRRQRRHAQAELDHDRNLLRHDRIRFVDVMSHEFRTPLNIINVAAGMLARYGERMGAPERQERICEIQDAVTRMTRVIDKVLLTSRIELHQWSLRPERFELAAWCKEFLAHNTGSLRERERIRVRIAGLPSAVTLDLRVIEISLQNLLSNALKYSPANSPIDLEIGSGGRGRIAFTVRDYGIGIPESDIANVFSSFYRGANVGDVPGSGLGLAIVKGCVDLYGGTVDVESSPGNGTCIRMCVPECARPADVAAGSPGETIPA